MQLGSPSQISRLSWRCRLSCPISTAGLKATGSNLLAPKTASCSACSSLRASGKVCKSFNALIGAGRVPGRLPESCVSTHFIGDPVEELARAGHLLKPALVVVEMVVGRNQQDCLAGESSKKWTLTDRLICCTSQKSASLATCLATCSDTK